MRYLIISPHLDDAALSCGGFIHQRVSAGDDVFAATVCTADAPINWRDSPAAHHVHAEWKLGNQPYPLRRREDEAACAALGARAIHLGLADAVYRFDATGAPYYTNNFMGGHPIPADARAQGDMLTNTLESLLRKMGLRQLRVIAPLGLGGHVDHMIARHSAQRVCAAHKLKLSYFEDYPYGEREDVHKSPAARGLASHVVALSANDIEARIRTILCYPSQLQPVFRLETGHELEQAVRARVNVYTRNIGGERYWTST